MNGYKSNCQLYKISDIKMAKSGLSKLYQAPCNPRNYMYFRHFSLIGLHAKTGISKNSLKYENQFGFMPNANFMKFKTSEIYY